MLLQLSHTKLNVYQSSQELILECYRITTQFPNEEKFAMIQQIRRAALSVHLNIAEGCSRKSKVERADILKWQEDRSLKLMRQFAQVKLRPRKSYSLWEML
jgi:hypothetical protein